MVGIGELQVNLWGFGGIILDLSLRALGANMKKTI